MDLDLAHRRYLQQAEWTAQLRRHIFTRAGLPNTQRVLEIGCGTGAVLGTISAPRATLIGLDIDRAALNIAKSNAPMARLLAADAHSLPFASGSFDLTFFHFVLLWLADPAKALTEARRVTRRGGAVIAFAEPDYTQRIDEPADLAKLGRLQTDALRSQGADPGIGSRLLALFENAGIRPRENGQLSTDTNAGVDKLESEVLKADLLGRVPQRELEHLLKLNQEASLTGTRSIYVPTFYAWGLVN